MAKDCPDSVEVRLGIAPGMKGKARGDEVDEELEDESDTV